MSKNRNNKNTKWFADGYARGAYWAARWNEAQGEFDTELFHVKIVGLSDEEFKAECSRAQKARAAWIKEQNAKA
jgi:hypothetical protein